MYASSRARFVDVCVPSTWLCHRQPSVTTRLGWHRLEPLHPEAPCAARRTDAQICLGHYRCRHSTLQGSRRHSAMRRTSGPDTVMPRESTQAEWTGWRQPDGLHVVRTRPCPATGRCSPAGSIPGWSRSRSTGSAGGWGGAPSDRAPVARDHGEGPAVPPRPAHGVRHR